MNCLTCNAIPTSQLYHPGQGKTLVSIVIHGSTRHSQAKTGIQPWHQSVQRTSGFLVVE